MLAASFAEDSRVSRKRFFCSNDTFVTDTTLMEVGQRSLVATGFSWETWNVG